MQSSRLRASNEPSEPLLKRPRPSEEPPQLDGLSLSSSQLSDNDSSPPASVPSKLHHRWKFDARAKIQNAAHTYFPKNSLVYHFLDVYDDVVDKNGLGELESCILRCGICGGGRWRWEKGGKSKGSTSNMRDHMAEHHPDIWKPADQFDRRMLGTGVHGKVEDNTQATENALIKRPFTLDEWYRRVTRWIAMRNHAFTELDNDEYREMVLYLRPALEEHLVRATAIKERLLGHAEAMRKSTKQYLQNLSSLMAVACDGWTSSNRIAFLAIVGSWITPEWTLEETLLDFVELQGAHSGENMANVVGKSLTDLGLVNQVVSLVSDNASNNKTLVRHLSAQLQRSSPDARWDGTKGHIRCLAHVIHLSVMSLLRALQAVPESVDTQDFDYNDKNFTVEDAEAIVAENNNEAFEKDDSDTADPLVNLHSGISKIRKISKLVRSSPQRMELFRSIAEQIEERNMRIARTEGRPYTRKRIKTLILDVVTRWNSMLYMLERAVELREAIDSLTMHPRDKVYHLYALSSDDWAAIIRVCSWLKFFRDASLCMSGEKYPTLSFSLRIYFILIQYVSKLQSDSATGKSPVALAGLTACKAKLIEYFDQSTYDSEYYYFAMVLDPRYKDSIFKVNASIVDELFSSEWTSDCANALVETCREFYSLPSDDSPHDPKLMKPEILDFDTFSHAFKASVPQSSGHSFDKRTLAQELSDYLSESIIPDTGSPLEWWRNNAARFPRLALMARDFLCIPGTSVAVERVLSTGRDVISLRRASLSAETIRTLMNYRAGIVLEKRTSKISL